MGAGDAIALPFRDVIMPMLGGVLLRLYDGEEGGGDEAVDTDDTDDREAPFSGPSAVPHWAWAFWMTLVLSSRNMRES